MEHNAKFRHELKYLCSRPEIEMLRTRLSAVMQRDPHAQETGMYHIRSIYFDDLYDSSFEDNSSGLNAREKWRIRIYNSSSSRITRKRMFILFFICKPSIRRCLSDYTTHLFCMQESSMHRRGKKARLPW